MVRDVPGYECHDGGGFFGRCERDLRISTERSGGFPYETDSLGEGFYFAGRQKSLEIGGEEFILDLLFFHHPTRRFVVIDLKIGPFQAEFAGKMNLYVNAVNKFIASDEDRTTVGFILCAGRNEAVAHLTLQGVATPIAVTRYTVGEHGVVLAGEDAQVTAGLEEEVEGLRRVEQQVAEFAARRARELVESNEDTAS